MLQDRTGTSPTSPTALSHTPWPILPWMHALQIPWEEGDGMGTLALRAQGSAWEQHP